MKVYSNLPLKVRDEIILVINDKPITWNVAYNEIKHSTKIGEMIINKFVKMGGHLMADEEQITQDEIDVVIARLRAIPDNALITIGIPEGSLSKEQLMNEVKNLTPLGKEIIRMQMSYLRSFKRG